MKKNNVDVFLFLYKNMPEKLFDLLSHKISKIRSLCIKKEITEIKEAEDKLTRAIKEKSFSRIMAEIETLRGLYKHHGIHPDTKQSGYYYMLRLLDQIGEFAIVAFT